MYNSRQKQIEGESQTYRVAHKPPPSSPDSDPTRPSYRLRFIQDGDLYNYDRATTAGLSVACLRAGDEANGLDLFNAALTPAPWLSSEGEVEDLEDKTEEEIDAMLLEMAEKDENEEDEDSILAAEGEVLPEILGYYLDRADKDSSQEAARGVSGVWRGWWRGRGV